LRTDCSGRTSDVIAEYEWDACKPIVGDSYELPVAWQDVADLPRNDTTVTLEFQLKNAELYGFQITSYEPNE